MYKIRIYTKSGNQIELWVKEFKLSPGRLGYKEWKAVWAGDNSPRILALQPSQIEAVVVLEERDISKKTLPQKGQDNLKNKLCKCPEDGHYAGCNYLTYMSWDEV